MNESLNNKKRDSYDESRKQITKVRTKAIKEGRDEDEAVREYNLREQIQKIRDKAKEEGRDQDQAVREYNQRMLNAPEELEREKIIQATEKGIKEELKRRSNG